MGMCPEAISRTSVASRLRAILAAYPSARDVLGPHGIPPLEHARAGGEHAREVLELLETSEVSR